MSRHHHLQIKNGFDIMTEYPKKPKKKPKKDNLGAFMVNDPDKAVKDVKNKKSKKDDDDE